MPIISLFDLFTKSSPLNSISPPTIFPGYNKSFIIDKEVTLFPLPDSPTIPNDSPFSTSKLMPLIALTSPK